MTLRRGPWGWTLGLLRAAVRRPPGMWTLVVLALLSGALPARAVAAGDVRSLGPAPAQQQLALDIPLLADDTGLERFALSVATPGSASYGRYATVAELARRFGARPAASRAVMRYLRRAGASAVVLSPTRMYVQADMTVAAAERTFGTGLSTLRADGQSFIGPAGLAGGAHAAGAGALPRGLRGLASGVVGLDAQRLSTPQIAALSPARARAAGTPTSAYLPRSGSASGCRAGRSAHGGFTPNQYLTAYGYSALQHAGSRGAGERVALIEIDGFKHSDITAFDACFRLHTPPIRTYTVGFRRALAAGGESTLDLELLTAAAPRLASLDVYENRGTASQILRAFTAPLVAPGAKPQVVSASLGICEQFLELSMGPSGIQSIERDLALAAATGITVLASAGDQGSSSCQLNDGRVVRQLGVSYPASSPFATGVGGTNFFLNAHNQILDETVWNDAAIRATAGGGGISDLFARPSYQPAVLGVDARVVPDVSLLADLAPGYSIFCTAHAESTCRGWTSVGGTSAAAPLLAGGLALVDQDLRSHQRQALGLANPLFYELAAAPSTSSIFRDVRTGDNDLGAYLPGGGGPLGCCSAAPGFDDASGLGSVNLAALARAAVRILPRAPQLSLRLPGGQRPLRDRAILARLACSSACRVYVSGNVVLSASVGFGIRSAVRRLRRAGTLTLRLGLSSAQLGRITAALRAHHHVYTELFGVALDAQGHPQVVTPGAVARL